MSKQFLGVIAAIILIFIGIFVFSGSKSNNSGSKSSHGKPTQHVIGAGTTGVTLVEYGDYQCPFCGQYYPVLKQVQAQYGDKIKFQFRNFPLVSLHQNAFAGARAAEAAGLQDKYWGMHDLLYENQTAWSEGRDPNSYFEQYAKQLGLNLAQFKQDYASSEVNDAINADMAAGNKLNITGTPTFFLDGKQVQIGEDPAAFAKVIDAEIAKNAGQAANTAAPTGAGATAQTKTPAKSSQ